MIFLYKFQKGTKNKLWNTYEHVTRIPILKHPMLRHYTLDVFFLTSGTRLTPLVFDPPFKPTLGGSATEFLYFFCFTLFLK